MSNRLCVSYLEAIQELGIADECAAFGVSASCGTCDDHQPWNARQRQFFTRKLIQAQEDIENYLGFPLCPKEICDERHVLECPIRLTNYPIAYLGKRVALETRELTVKYRRRKKCDFLDILPVQSGTVCPEDDWVGIVIVDNIPEGIEADDIHFGYDNETCFRTQMVLEQPCLEPFTDGQILCEQDDPLVGDGYVAVWPKCQLIHPNCDGANLSNTAGDLNCFIETVEVTFFTIDDTNAVVAAGSCSCGACTTVPATPDLTIEIGDGLRGEVCVTTNSTWLSNCSCPLTNRVYITYGVDLNCFQPSSLVSLLVGLRALLLAGVKRLCGCDCFSDIINWWLDTEESDANRAIVSPADYPFGTTRAGTEIGRILSRMRDDLMRKGQVTPIAGVLTHRKTVARWRDVRDLSGGVMNRG